MSSSAIYSGMTMPSSPSRVDSSIDDSTRCVICKQATCDIQIVSCGCLLHTTCLPLDILFANKQPTRTTNHDNLQTNNQQMTFCPCCRQLPIQQIRVLPLPTDLLEEAGRLRDNDNEDMSITNEVTSLACASSNSIALFNGANKRAFASTKKASVNRSYRTGRWSSDEMAYVDRLIRSFDAGLLPLPHGIKLNEFLCDLLSCRTSRLTKKLKNAKLSARTYRSAGDKTIGSFSMYNVGEDIQRAQAQFLKSITPDWVRMELQFNILRQWRTHLANFCLQQSYLDLDTKEWFASLGNADDYVSITSSKETNLQDKRKRMRSALTEDASVAAQSLSNETSSGFEYPESFASSDKEGVFIGGMSFKRLSNANLRSLTKNEEKGEALRINTDVGEDPVVSQSRERVDSLSGSISRMASSSRKFSFEASALFEQTMKHSTSISSFLELFNTPDTRPVCSSKRPSFLDIASPDVAYAEELDTSDTNQQQSDPEVDSIIDEAILQSSTNELPSNFLKEIAKFLSENNSSFQHVDIWVPMDVSNSSIVGKQHIGGSSTTATTSSDDVAGIIYYGAQEASPSLRLSHAGHITVRADSQTLNRLNEFGVYSKNFSFSPGFGLPGKVFLSRSPLWENNLASQSAQTFARVGGAKIYGVNTVLCVPVVTPIGTMVVGLYSTQNLSRDVKWEHKCMDFFWRLRPEPKWKLTIDVGLSAGPSDADKMSASSNLPTSSPRMESMKRTSFVIPPSPTLTPQFKPQQAPPPARNVSFDLSLNDKKLSTIPPEESLAVLIGKYMPLERGLSSSQNDDFAGSLMTLRLLLLRQKWCSADESKIAETIIGKYQSYLCDANKTEREIIVSIVNDWKRLVSSPAVMPAQMTMSHQPRHRHNSCSSSYSSISIPSMTQPNSSPAYSPKANSFLPSIGVQSSTNQFSLSLPLVTSGVSSDNFSSSMSTVRHEQAAVQTNFVPRVVSEQGPIKTDHDEQNFDVD